MATHLRDELYCYPACGQPHVETYLTEQPEQVTCECCKQTAQYLRVSAPAPLPSWMLGNRVSVRLAQLAGTRQEPSVEQLATFSTMIDLTAQAPANHHASVKGEMDEDGTMLVGLTEDGATRYCRFGRDGEREGDWF
jgi:hypothetical protein